MKKKMSLSFLVLSILTLLSLPDTAKILWNTPAAIRTLSPGFLVYYLAALLRAFTPITLAVLLIVNTRRPVKRAMDPILQILGLAWLVSGILDVDMFFRDEFSPALLLFMLPVAVNFISELLIGTVLVGTAFCIRLQKKSKVLSGLTFVGCYLNLAPLAMSLLEIGFYNPLHQALLPLLLLAGVGLLPVTVYDYDNCTFVDKKTLLSIGMLTAVFLALLLITRLG